MRMSFDVLAARALRMQHAIGRPGPSLSIDVLAITAIALAIWVATADPARPLEPDAVQRIFIAEDWLRRPEWIASGVWGPLHTYLLAGALSLFDDRLTATHALSFTSQLGIACLLYLLGRWRGDRVAGWGGTMLWLLSPLALRFDDDGVAEPIFVLCVLGALAALWWMFALAPAARLRALLCAAAAGLMWTLAAAVRYEAWALLPVVALLCLPAGWRAAACFAAPALLFPALWMAGNAAAHGDPLYGIHANRDWVVLSEGFVPGGSAKQLLRKALFVPIGFAFGFGLLTTALLALSLRRAFAAGPFGRLVVGVLATLLALIVWQVTFGHLLQRSRYLALPFVLALVAIGLDPRWQARWRSVGAVRGVAALLLVAGSTLGVTALAARAPGPLRGDALSYLPPRPVPPEVLQLGRIVGERLAPGELLVVDFWDWAETHHVALAGSERKGYVAVLPGGRLERPDTARLREQACMRARGLMLLARGSRFDALRPVDVGAASVVGLKADIQPIALPEALALRFQLLHFSARPGACPAAAPARPWVGPRPVPSLPPPDPLLPSTRTAATAR